MRHTFSLLLLATSLFACANHRPLQDADLTVPEALRVYPSDRLVAQYVPSPPDDVYQQQVVSRGTAGKVLAQADEDGHHRIWVTFDPTCSTPDCAFVFESREDTYVITQAPAKEGYAPPSLYRGSVSKRNRLENAPPIHLEVH